jgi:hypothetical protein
VSDLPRRWEFREYLRGDFNTSFFALARRLLDEQPRGGGAPGGVEAWRYLRPAGRRRAVLRAPGCSDVEIPASVVTGGRTFAAGQLVSVASHADGVSVLGEPPSGLVGASRFPRSELSGDLSQPRLTSSTPEALPGEGATAVTFSGEQLLSGDLLTAEVWSGWLVDLGVAGYDAMQPQWVADPWITIDSEANVDATTMTASVTVDAASPWPRTVQVRVDRA